MVQAFPLLPIPYERDEKKILLQYVIEGLQYIVFILYIYIYKLRRVQLYFLLLIVTSKS